MNDTLDPVTLAVLRGRLEQVADEMDATLYRSAFNPIIAEAHDACHGLYDATSGDTLVQGKSGLPVFVVGTSRSTLSAAYLGGALHGEIAGVVLTSSLFYRDQRARFPELAGYDWSKVKVPMLFVHHADDSCGATPYHEAQRVGRRFPLVTVKGGKTAESPPCEPFAQHGFYGKEAETVDAIAAWMLGRPFPKDI